MVTAFNREVTPLVAEQTICADLVDAQMRMLRLLDFKPDLTHHGGLRLVGNIDQIDAAGAELVADEQIRMPVVADAQGLLAGAGRIPRDAAQLMDARRRHAVDRKSTRLNSSH